jgi:ABC-type phosphate transport system substrate-binding protein
MRFFNTTMLVASALATVGAANAEMVVVVNAKHPASSLTAAQVADVYLGKDTSFAPLDLPESSAERGAFYTKVAGKDSAQVKAIWARLVFTGKSQPPKELGSSSDAVKAVGSNDKGIAYVDKSAVDASVKVVLSVQ